MSTSTRLSILVRSCTGRLLGVTVALAVLLTPAVLFAEPAQADSAVGVKSGSFVLHGAGFGHGWGMSQYGAYGMARQGRDWKQILGFYYPGTTRKTLARGSTIKVWVSADNDNSLRVRPAAGLKITDGSGHSFAVPTGSKYKSWRIARSGAGYQLTYHDSTNRNIVVRTKLSNTTWSFSTKAKIVKVRMPDGSIRQYRGSVQLIKRGSGGRTVNKLALEDYVKAVIPIEMPTSWAKDAVRAQAVAARSFAIHHRDVHSYSGYDVCDTSNCQNYRGYALITSKGKRTVRETSGGNAATKATARVILIYQGKAALTQFAPSNGGHTAQGDFAYLPAHADPYDAVIQSQAWTRTIKATSIAKAWPSVGTVKKLQITRRDGDGRWGGRVLSIRIIGSKKTITVGGKTFQSRFDMRSNLFTAAR